jgi:hypothetical protein
MEPKMSDFIYWLYSGSSGKTYFNAIRDGRQITIERTPDIAKLDEDLRNLRDQRNQVSADFNNRFASGGPPIDVLNAEVSTLPTIDAAITVAENNLWNELTKETTP